MSWIIIWYELDKREQISRNDWLRVRKILFWRPERNVIMLCYSAFAHIIKLLSDRIQFKVITKKYSKYIEPVNQKTKFNLDSLK